LVKAVVFLVLASVLSVVQAEDWKALQDEEIREALIDREIVYKSQGNSSQSFSSGGETTFVEGRPSLGYWRVDNNQYCSKWPPSSQWACYDVFLNSGGNTVRFRGTDGVNWDGTYK